MLLAIDTATQVISLALHDGQNLLTEITWQTANNHTIQLAPAIHNLLRQAEASLDQLTVLAVSIGPGSYSGLRVGVALAKGMAAARNLPLVGLSTLDILAAAQPHYQGGLVVMVQAGRGRITVGRYQWRKGRWGPRGAPQIMEWEDLFNNIDGPAVLSGEVNTNGLAALEAAQGRGVPITLAPAAYRLRRAGFLAEEAWTRYKADPTGFEAAKLLPVYIKTPDTPTEL
jgi:tRNA threonylcarbamoyladenosine biosynthesis protein TsaB